MIVIVSWAFENNLVYLRSILVGSMIVTVFWAIEKYLSLFYGYFGWVDDCDSFLVY